LERALRLEKNVIRELEIKIMLLILKKYTSKLREEVYGFFEGITEKKIGWFLEKDELIKANIIIWMLAVLLHCAMFYITLF